MQTLVMLLFHINTQISDKSTGPMDYLRPLLSTLPPIQSQIELSRSQLFKRSLDSLILGFMGPSVINWKRICTHSIRCCRVYGESTHSYSLIYCRSPKSQQTIKIFSNSQHSSRSPYKIINQEAINSLWIWLRERVSRGDGEAINRGNITPCTQSNPFLRLSLE